MKKVMFKFLYNSTIKKNECARKKYINRMMKLHYISLTFTESIDIVIQLNQKLRSVTDLIYAEIYYILN